jgi:hypothetical protein
MLHETQHVCSKVTQYFADCILNFVYEHDVGDNVSISLIIIIIIIMMKN